MSTMSPERVAVEVLNGIQATLSTPAMKAAADAATGS
jgi:hypothetical protein